MSKAYISNKSVGKLISETQDKALARLTIDPTLLFDYYVSLTVYDCGGTWQAWLDYGKSGEKPTHEVVVDGREYVEGKTLRGAIIKLRKQVLDKDISISIRRHK
jgi:TFIIF-interacting CTD phosphatase-like protein